MTVSYLTQSIRSCHLHPALEAGNETTAIGLDAIGEGGVLALIDQYFVLFLIIFIGILLLILLPIILRHRSRKPSKVDLKLAELEREREKLELMSKRMLIEKLRESAITPTDDERAQLERIQLDNTVLSRKIAHTMNEVDQRTKRLELGTDTAKLFETLSQVKEHEQGMFGKSL